MVHSLFHVGTLYSRVIAYLARANFAHDEYSVCINADTTAMFAWVVAVGMLQLEPSGFMPTTRRRLAVYHAPMRATLNVMRLIVPGGLHWARLDQTPRGLVLPQRWALFHSPALPMQFLQRLPRGTRASAAAWNPANWIMSYDPNYGSLILR